MVDWLSLVSLVKVKCKIFIQINAHKSTCQSVKCNGVQKTKIVKCNGNIVHNSVWMW